MRVGRYRQHLTIGVGDLDRSAGDVGQPEAPLFRPEAFEFFRAGKHHPVASDDSRERIGLRFNRHRWVCLESAGTSSMLHRGRLRQRKRRAPACHDRGAPRRGSPTNG
jgi:hypothetical protein